jgi:hypothetical protein
VLVVAIVIGIGVGLASGYIPWWMVVAAPVCLYFEVKELEMARTKEENASLRGRIADLERKTSRPSSLVSS